MSPAREAVSARHGRIEAMRNMAVILKLSGVWRNYCYVVSSKIHGSMLASLKFEVQRICDILS